MEYSALIFTYRLCKNLLAQLVVFSLLPYVWMLDNGVGVIPSICLYTVIYTIFWHNKILRTPFHGLFLPYLFYAVFSVLLYSVFDNWCHSLWFCLVLPLYGLACFVFVRLFSKYSRRLSRRCPFPDTVRILLFLSLFIVLKTMSVLYISTGYGSMEKEKQDIIERRNYLVDKFVNATPREVLDHLPSSIGEQFQGEWALYLCSMFSAALVNISRLYPETAQDNLCYIQRLIDTVMSPELRAYDTNRWGEDALETLHGNKSHISYISHLAWMICGYKSVGGDDRYDAVLSKLCETMNRRILSSHSLNLPTYPGESIYVPDMLVAIVALKQYSQMTDNRYSSTVDKWLARAQREWLDEESGLLVSFLGTDGKQNTDAPVKGSYSALNCYYLTLIDPKFANEQYRLLKKHLWRDNFIPGLCEYKEWTPVFGLDVDAGPLVFGLSPSGTAFLTGSATYFEDSATRTHLLTTAETAGHTIAYGNTRHYLLAHLALVGEPIMLAMRTHGK